MVKISIIIPFYKAEKYISRLVENLQSATKDLSENCYEIIFVDDFGLDNSRMLLESQNKISIKIVDCGKNQGLGGARNLGVSKSSGNWIMFMDHDDLLFESAISLLIDKVNENENYNFIRFNYVERNQNRDIYHIFEGKKNYVDAVFPVMAWSKIIKKDLYIESKKFVKYEDSIWTFDFIDKKIYKRINYGYLSKYIYIYDRTNENSITTQIHYEDKKLVHKRLVHSLLNCDDDIKEQLQLLYLYTLKYSLLKIRKWDATWILIKAIPSISVFELVKVACIRSDNNENKTS